MIFGICLNTGQVKNAMRAIVTAFGYIVANTGGLADDAINGTASGGSASVCAPCGDHGR